MAKSIPYQGRQVEAEEVEVITTNEPWNEYQLADGKVLMVKTVLVSIYRAVNEKDQENEPIYITQTHNVVRVK